MRDDRIFLVFETNTERKEVILFYFYMKRSYYFPQFLCFRGLVWHNLFKILPALSYSIAFHLLNRQEL
jgi:hypothetical protein